MSDDKKKKYELEQIGEMPKMSPRYTPQPGVVLTPLPPDKQSVVDAFNVADQRDEWIAGAIAKINRNMFVVLQAALDAIEAANGVHARLNRIEATPWAMAKRLLRWAAIFAAGIYGKYLLKKIFGIDVEVHMPP